MGVSGGSCYFENNAYDYVQPTLDPEIFGSVGDYDTLWNAYYLNILDGVMGEPLKVIGRSLRPLNSSTTRFSPSSISA